MRKVAPTMAERAWSGLDRRLSLAACQGTVGLPSDGYEIWPPGCRHARPGWSAMWWLICARSARCAGRAVDPDRGARIGRSARTGTRVSRSRSGLRIPPADCRNTVDTAILHFLSSVDAARAKDRVRRSQQVYQRRRDARLARREQAARQAQIAATADRSNDEVWPAVAPKRGAWRPSVQRATSTVAAHRPRRRGCSRNPGPRGGPSCSRSPQFRCAYHPAACCTCLAVVPRLLA